jgi:hypothetical protein
MTPLDDLLDQVRAALLSGDLSALSALDEQIFAASNRLAAPDMATAHRLHRKAERNARLLQAAGRGLRAARERMAEIVSGPGLATYDARGRKAALSGPAHALGRF